MGFFSGLAAEKYDRQYSDKKLFQRILEYFKRQTRSLLIIFIAIISRAVIEAIMPVIVARGLDQLTQELITTRFISHTFWGYLVTRCAELAE
jgi:ATP-binding cassette, subfamily B, bacterial